MSNPNIQDCWGSSLGGLSVFWLLLVTTACHAESSRQEVIIYLANETAPVDEERRNYETIIGWLNSDMSPKTERIVASLNLDREQFPAAVGLEVSDLTLEVPKQQSSGGLVIVTNRLFRGGKCLLWKPAFERVRKTRLPIDPTNENFILAANPLSRSEMLESVLSFVSQQFDPLQHRFVVILKSHGSGAKIVTPRLAVRAEETNRDEILRITNSEVPDEELPLWVDRLGITKSELFSVLHDAGSRHEMSFSLVFLEACNATKHQFSRGDLPDNVDRLLVIREQANYINVLYSDVVQRQDEAGSFSSGLLSDLPEKFTLIDRNHRGDTIAQCWAWPRIGYFIPLVLWLMWVAWHVARRPREVCRLDPTVAGTPLPAKNSTPEP